MWFIAIGVPKDVAQNAEKILKEAINEVKKERGIEHPYEVVRKFEQKVRKFPTGQKEFRYIYANTPLYNIRDLGTYIQVVKRLAESAWGEGNCEIIYAKAYPEYLDDPIIKPSDFLTEIALGLSIVALGATTYNLIKKLNLRRRKEVKQS